MTGERIDGRAVWQLTGADVATFLQGVVSNDVLPLTRGPGMVWAALLTPQGKYLADFFIIRPQGDGQAWLIDLPEPLAPDLLKRFQLYRLRADVRIDPAALQVTRGLGPAPQGAFPDPRHPGLGWRALGTAAGRDPVTDWDGLRVALLVPEYPADLVPGDSYLLEMGFDRLHGVDFRKGCYVGQEVTARMRHKTELKKGLVRLAVLSGQAEAGMAITMEDGRDAGRLGTLASGKALALMRLDRLQGPLRAGSALLRHDAGEADAAPQK